MTLKVSRVLEKVQALKDYLETNCEALNDYQAVALDATLEQAWTISCRRRGGAKRPEEERRVR